LFSFVPRLVSNALRWTGRRYSLSVVEGKVVQGGLRNKNPAPP
jgi:hypothetical protein